MHKLGDGLQYVVYDAGRGRVFKRVTTTKEKIAKLKSWNYKNPKDINNKIKSINKHLNKSMSTVQLLISKQLVLPQLLGNPTFTRNHNYTQDIITPLGEYLNSHTLNQNKKIIENYIGLVETLWQYGIGEITRNFTINNGVQKDGSVILTDFGECTFYKQTIANQITKNKMLNQHSFKSLGNTPLQIFAIQLFKKEITLKKLNHYWKKNI